MKKKSKFIFLYIFLFVSTTTVLAQKRNTFAIGFNLTHFSDWNKRPINLFNPELFLLKEYSENKNLLFSFDVFYGEFPRNQKSKIGSIMQRLNFNLKTNYLLTFKTTMVGIGPSIRLRKEDKILYFYPPINPFEAVSDPNKYHFDFGLNASAVRNIRFSKRGGVIMKLSYSLYSKGRNPLNLGFFYGWKW